MRARLITVLGAILSIALIVYLVATFDLAAAARALEVADRRWLIAGALFYTLAFPLRGLRWSLLLARIAPVSTRAATEVFAIGFLANNVMPARLGDVARAFVLARRERVPASSTFATVLLERVFDGLVVVGMMLLVLRFVPEGSSSLFVDGMALVMAIAFPGAVAVAALIVWNEARALRLFAWFLRPLPPALASRIHALLARLTEGLHALKSARDSARIATLSILIWLIEVGVYMLAGRAFGLDVPAEGMILVMAVLTLGLTLPSAPAFVGVFEGLIVAAVTLYGVPGPLALAFAVTMHLIHFSIGSLLGGYFAWRMGLNMRELRTAADRPSLQPGASAVPES